MNTAMWTGEDILLVGLCIVLGTLALGFFVTIFVADFREKRSKSSSRRPLRHKNGNSH